MTPRPVFLSHPSSLDHDTGGHPESVQRLLALHAELERHDYLGYERADSPLAQRRVLERVHPGAYIDSIAEFAAAGGGELDADTIVSPGSYLAALHAAGGAVELVERIVSGGAGAVGFSAHRPPGHHALPGRAMGFCLFNNIAIAARHAIDELGLERVLVLDWDVHHGNGTSDIFWEDGQVLFISLHQWPLYPGSGRASDVGRGHGHGATINIPVPPGTGDDAYVSLLRDVVAPVARIFCPQLILISAGYDAHLEDPLADCAVTDAGYAAMAALMRGIAQELGVGIGCVLEGGYAVHALARSVAATMSSLLPVQAPDLGPSVHPLAVDALVRLREFWPSLG